MQNAVGSLIAFVVFDFVVWSFELLWSLEFGIWNFHPGDGEAVCPLQASRRCLAASKNSSMVLASAFSRASWNSFKSSTNTPRTRARFLRFASAISRHISGELEAMRVVSRNPLAHNNACSLGCAGLRT